MYSYGSYIEGNRSYYQGHVEASESYIRLLEHELNKNGFNDETIIKTESVVNNSSRASQSSHLLEVTYTHNDMSVIRLMSLIKCLRGLQEDHNKTYGTSSGYYELLTYFLEMTVRVTEDIRSTMIESNVVTTLHPLLRIRAVAMHRDEVHKLPDVVKNLKLFDMAYPGLLNVDYDAIEEAPVINFTVETSYVTIPVLIYLLSKFDIGSSCSMVRELQRVHESTYLLKNNKYLKEFMSYYAVNAINTNEIKYTLIEKYAKYADEASAAGNEYSMKEFVKLMTNDEGSYAYCSSCNKLTNNSALERAEYLEGKICIQCSASLEPHIYLQKIGYQL